MGKIRYIVIAVFLVLMSVGVPSWFINASNLVQSLTYHAFHVNAFHCAANCIAFYFLMHRTSVKESLLAYTIACIVYPVSPIPVLGISNFLYAVMGLRTPSFSNGWWKRRETIIFLVVTALMVFVPKISALTHILSFAIGTLISQAVIWTRKMDETYERVNKK